MRGKAGIPLYKALKKIDPDVKDEHQFDWLYLPNYNLIIELDEIQHFTEERGITFDFYDGITLNYDIHRWKTLCEKYKKKDSDPLTRDWKRAFRDSIRDLRSHENGVPLLC